MILEFELLSEMIRYEIDIENINIFQLHIDPLIKEFMIDNVVMTRRYSKYTYLEFFNTKEYINSLIHRSVEFIGTRNHYDGSSDIVIRGDTLIFLGLLNTISYVYYNDVNDLGLKESLKINIMNILSELLPLEYKTHDMITYTNIITLIINHMKSELEVKNLLFEFVISDTFVSAMDAIYSRKSKSYVLDKVEHILISDGNDTKYDLLEGYMILNNIERDLTFNMILYNLDKTRDNISEKLLLSWNEQMDRLLQLTGFFASTGTPLYITPMYIKVLKIFEAEYVNKILLSWSGLKDYKF